MNRSVNADIVAGQIFNAVTLHCIDKLFDNKYYGYCSHCWIEEYSIEAISTCPDAEKSNSISLGGIINNCFYLAYRSVPCIDEAKVAFGRQAGKNRYSTKGINIYYATQY